jgi:hypothetical protein
MSFFDKIKDMFTRKPDETDNENLVSVITMEAKYDEEDLVGAARDLKMLLEEYGRRKRHNHRTKGRQFIHFILSNKHKNLKNAGYQHWQNIDKILSLNSDTAYPYHKKNLRKAMDFFEKEIRNLDSIIFEKE